MKTNAVIDAILSAAPSAPSRTSRSRARTSRPSWPAANGPRRRTTARSRRSSSWTTAPASPPWPRPCADARPHSVRHVRAPDHRDRRAREGRAVRPRGRRLRDGEVLMLATHSRHRQRVDQPAAGRLRRAYRARRARRAGRSRRQRVHGVCALGYAAAAAPPRAHERRRLGQVGRPADLHAFFQTHRLLLAPMAGVSDEAFRALCREQGADLTYTEMVSAKGLSYANEKTRHLLRLAPGEDQVAVQLFGHEPDTMAAQAAWIEREMGRRWPTLTSTWAARAQDRVEGRRLGAHEGSGAGRLHRARRGAGCELSRHGEVPSRLGAGR